MRKIEIMKRKFEDKLIRKGMLMTTDGEVIRPPVIKYKKLGEKILYLLNLSRLHLNVNEISNYLVKDKKIIGKVMMKLTYTDIDIIHRMKKGRKYYYTASLGKDTDLKTTYKLIRKTATKHIK